MRYRSCEELPHVGTDVVDVGYRQELIDGEGEDAAGLPLRHRERAMAVAEMRRRRLPGNRDGIVDRGLDASTGQEPLQLVAAVGLHHEGMEGIELDVAAGRHEYGKTVE